jgi:hypothetical protein
MVQLFYGAWEFTLGVRSNVSTTEIASVQALMLHIAIAAGWSSWFNKSKCACEICDLEALYQENGLEGASWKETHGRGIDK